MVYLDNAATTQKPISVIEQVDLYYKSYNSNVHRGVHYLANKATEKMESSREVVRQFLHAKDVEEVIFTGGTTDGINTVAMGWGRKHLGSGDVILVSRSEHHANLVPWQQVALETGCTLEIIELQDNGEWEVDFENKVKSTTKLVAVAWVSNALGVIHPVERLIAKAKEVGAMVLIDAAQAVTHFPVDVQLLNCDWLVFSGHKLFSTTGTGVLYGKKAVMESMNVVRTGGEMIQEVSLEKGTTFQVLPYRFEAGTPNIEGIIALGEAIRWFQSVSWNTIQSIEKMQMEWMSGLIQAEGRVRWLAEGARKAAVFSFVSDVAHSGDIGTLLDQQGIAIRTGHHCAQPLWQQWGLAGSARASFALYNNQEDVNRFSEALKKAMNLLV